MLKSKRNTGNLVLCILEVLVGILLLVNPAGFTSGIIITVGVLLMLLGIRSIVSYFREEPEAAAAENGLCKGLVFLLFGLFCAFKSEWFIVTFPVLTVIYGMATLLTGIGKVQGTVDMIRQKQKRWFVALIGAVLTLVFSVLILCNPFASTEFLWTFIAVSLIIEAVVDILTFVFGRN